MRCRNPYVSSFSIYVILQGFIALTPPPSRPTHTHLYMRIFWPGAHKLIQVLFATSYQLLGFFFPANFLACEISWLPSSFFSDCRTIQPVTLSKMGSVSHSFKIIFLLLECFFVLPKVNPFYGAQKNIRNISWRSALGQYYKKIYSHLL
jgi:hypothetical protein